MDQKPIQVIVMTSDKSQWVLPAFLRQWYKYAGFDYQNYAIHICGFDGNIRASSHTPFTYHVIGKQADYPADRWSDAFMWVLDNVAEQTFIFMMDDYLLVRSVDTPGVRCLYDYVYDRDYVLKADLTNDRMWSGGGTRYIYGYNTYGHCGHLDLIRSFPGTDYQLSLWGGIFNRDNLRRFILPRETAQQIELNGTNRVNQLGDSVLVLGTRQSPFKHVNVIQGGGVNHHETVGLPALDEQDRNFFMNLLKEQLC